MPRGARLDAPGTLHHVMIRGIERRTIVDDEKDREDFVSRLGKLSEETETAIYAWALMTNHAHILLRSGPAGLASFMRRLLAGYAAAYNRRHKRFGHLFQNRYKRIKYQLPAKEPEKETAALIGRECKKWKIELNVLRSGSRLAEVSRLRAFLAIQLVNDLGLPLAESARQLGVTTSAVAKILRRHS